MTTVTIMCLRADGACGVTIPAGLLDAAGIDPTSDLVARVESPGRIVLEPSDAMLARLQEKARRGKAVRDRGRRDAGEPPFPESMVDDLLEERARDRSLEGYRPSDS